MPFRERVKRALGRNSSVSDGSSLKQSKTNDSSSSKHRRYYPGEPIPKSKYRGPVDPAHKALMEGFSFGKNGNLRRSSGQSQYSPFGSRLPSRNPSRNPSIDGVEGWGVHLDPRTRHIKQTRKTGMSGVGQVMENEDDADDVTNVGGTRNHSISEPPSSVPSDDSGTDTLDDQDSEIPKQFARDHRPFTEADVTNALMKSISKNSHD